MRLTQAPIVRSFRIVAHERVVDQFVPAFDLLVDLALVRPKVVVALGATAARALVGRPVGIEASRSRQLDFGPGRSLLVTVHPSLLLRLPDPRAKARELRRLVTDLALAAP